MNMCANAHRKNGFAEASKNLSRYRSIYKNNFVEPLKKLCRTLMTILYIKNFNIVATILSVLLNYYFDGPTIIFRSISS